MKKSVFYLSVIAAVLLLASWSLLVQNKNKVYAVKLVAPQGKAIAAFAEGCFWCSEHIFEELAGVDSAVSGYAGGKTKNPTYEEVCSETTGHAETVLVYYNPKKISYSQLLDAFFTSHDPTTLNRQGPDRGTSYRSAIFYLTKEEGELAKQAVRKYTPTFKSAIVTEISPLTAFYRAEEYHQNYVQYNPSQGYVQAVSMPRFEKFKRECKLTMKKK
ncbi:peptide-methionine (S)-S-oxide reductase MsrA [Hufsiella ginkgonis]|uniref:Peptide methionine sulfoxide reductase MsrA n=1 Tax=Hufsiella ginkgonis TaxID=2695274 RepID=A0A7K1XW32_9SPHI|nr:peptide-methionine (S)-S-oxide reductase MsrA [Hufsiella ginkgonis]MXV14736.1 peptide-methionine (S)-S-oxide reductase MsrA [Hufsiella ginkgonis]